jgi:competence protein ComEA
VHLLLLLAALATAVPAVPPATDPAPRAARTRKAPMKGAVTGVVNVNRASEAELRLLPGIGRGRARTIIARRTKRPFTSIEEVARLKGMKGIVRKLRAHLTVEGDTTLRPVPP